MAIKRIISLVWYIAWLGGVQASEELACPPYVATSQKAVTPPSGWDLSTSSNEVMLHNESGVTFYSGPPSELASLHPDAQITKGQKLISTWRFRKKTHSDLGYWIECNYTYTHVVLSKRMPDSITECTTYSDKYSTSRIKNEYAFDRMECK